MRTPITKSCSGKFQMSSCSSSLSLQVSLSNLALFAPLSHFLQKLFLFRHEQLRLSPVDCAFTKHIPCHKFCNNGVVDSPSHLIHCANFIISWSDEYLLTVLLTKLFNSSTYYMYYISLHPYMFFPHVFYYAMYNSCICHIYYTYISTILGVEMKYIKMSSYKLM